MAKTIGLRLWATAALVGIGLTAAVQAQQASMSFFVTSVGKGDGANLGGLEGADAHCQALAKAAGATQTSWRAYLSTTAPGGDAGINARDRIGKGPWQNTKGVVVGKDVNDLHSASVNVNKATAITEKGEVVSGRGDAVTCTTSSPAPILKGCTRPLAATRPAGTGLRTVTVRPSSVIMT